MISKCHYEGKLNEVDSFAIRRELSTTKPWIFTGDFNDFERPPLLGKLVTNIIRGNPTKFPLSQKKEDKIGAVTRNICDYITSHFKSDRCLKYVSKSMGMYKRKFGRSN